MTNKKYLYIPIGISGSGKSTFLSKNFTANSIVSSDHCREIVSGDESNQKCSKDAFDLFHFIIEKKMKWNQLVVADATNLNSKARKKLLDIADKFEYNTVMLIMNVTLSECLERNKTRENPRPKHVLTRQHDSFMQAKEIILEKAFTTDCQYSQIWEKTQKYNEPQSITNMMGRLDIWENRTW